MLNCQKCGACCVNPQDSKWIEVTASDAKNINPFLLQNGDIEPYAMKQTDSGRCIAFIGKVGGDCGCSIYSNRPSICKAVQPYDDICNRLRQINKL